MPEVSVINGDINSALRRLKRIVEKAGIPKELRRREFHQKPSKIKQRNIAAAKKRQHKRLLRDNVKSDR